MKKTNFLHKLHKEGKLLAVEPNTDIKTAYIQKSEKSLSSAKALLKIGNLEDSVALAYYAMYHSLLALLFQIGIKCENHTAAILLLKQVFDIDNMSISKAKAERIDKQYSVDFQVNQKETHTAILIAEAFVASLNDFIDHLSNEKISTYHTLALKIITGAEGK